MKISKEQWGEFVKKNSDNSYSLVVCLCIMNIWEAGAKTKEEAETELHRAQLGITGAQADMAIGYALGNEPDFDIGYKAFSKEE